MHLGERHVLVFHPLMQQREHRPMVLPRPHYAGIVEWQDGKAVAWRDYFDLKTLEAPLAG